MSTAQDPDSDTARHAAPSTGVGPDDSLSASSTATDDWVPEDRAPSAAENNFMSFALFGFLILFGVGCLIVF